jgi:NADH:ubiquinone oxidoreductase subunit 2 (subunit N)
VLSIALYVLASSNRASISNEAGLKYLMGSFASGIILFGNLLDIYYRVVLML